jgi:hypothetical protein
LRRFHRRRRSRWQSGWLQKRCFGTCGRGRKRAPQAAHRRCMATPPDGLPPQAMGALTTDRKSIPPSRRRRRFRFPSGPLVFNGSYPKPSLTRSGRSSGASHRHHQSAVSSIGGPRPRTPARQSRHTNWGGSGNHPRVRKNEHRWVNSNERQGVPSTARRFRFNWSIEPMLFD